MATTQIQPTEVIAPRIGRPAAPVPRKARPVLWWAGLGAVFVLIYLYLFSRFLVDLPPNVSAGPTKVPAYMRWNIHAQEVLLPALAAILFYKWIFKPLFRRQKLPWDGLATAAIFTLLWQNFGVNWFHWWTGWNAVVVNRGSWYEHAPFWLAPNARGFAEAPLWNIGFYGSWIVLCIWFCYFMRAAKRRWPHLGKLGVFGVILGFTMLFDLAIELLWMRGGLYHYAGAVEGPWLLFSDHYYQFPLYEMVLFGACLAVMASVRYYRNDRGESIAERGIEEVRVGAKAKTWIRWLALTGIFNLIFLVYNLSMTPFALHSSEWPEDIQKRSYFTQEMCGARTDRACPGPGVPIGRPGSAYLTPEGEMSHPDDWNGPPGRQVPFME